jgi:hypothetical protein
MAFPYKRYPRQGKSGGGAQGVQIPLLAARKSLFSVKDFPRD